MKILFSSTSSKGNCSVIESGDGHLLIIDAGIKYKQVDKEIGYRLHKADALLITHSHTDHTKYIKDFMQSIQHIYVTKEMISQKFVDGFLISRLVRFYIHGRNQMLSGFEFVPCSMNHTNSNGSPCECYGFLILDKSTGEKMLWATDTQFINNKFFPLEYYCIECNYFEQNDYNEDDLDYMTKVVEQRRFNSHMSFESAVMFLEKQDLSKCKEIRLLHLSTSLSEEQRKNITKKLRSKLKDKLTSEIKGRKVKIIA